MRVLNRVVPLLLLAVAALVSGCASVPMTSMEDDVKAKTFAVKEDKAAIYVYRNESFGGAIPMTVSLDGKVAGQTGPQTYFMWEVDPGRMKSVRSPRTHLDGEAQYGGRQGLLHLAGSEDGHNGWRTWFRKWMRRPDARASGSASAPSQFLAPVRVLRCWSSSAPGDAIDSGMAVETELKLSIPAGASLSCAGTRCSPASSRNASLANTYYDTPALDLKRRRIAFAATGRPPGAVALTVKSAEPAAGGLASAANGRAPSLPGAFDFSHVDDRRLRAQLEELTPALLPVFSTDFLRTTWLLEPAPGVRIEMALDRGAVRCEDREDPICEIELELLEGRRRRCSTWRWRCRPTCRCGRRLPARRNGASACSSNRRCSRCGQGARLCFPACVRRRLFVAVALDCIGQLQRNEAGARAGEDPEFVHQARVAIRRLRSALRLWAPCCPGFGRRSRRAGVTWRNCLVRRAISTCSLPKPCRRCWPHFPRRRRRAGSRISPSGAASNGIARSGLLSRHLNSRPWCFHSRRRSVPCPRM